MTGEFRRPEPDDEGIELDDDVRAIAARYWRVARVAGAAYFSLWIGASVVAFVSRGLLAGLAVAAAVYLLGGAPLYRIRSEIELVTDRSPAAVRTEFRRPANPVTSMLVTRAEDVAPVDGANAATLRFTALRVFSAERRLVVTDGDDPTEADDDRGGADAGEEPPLYGRDHPGGWRSPGPIRMTLSSDGDVSWGSEVRIRETDGRTYVAIEAERRSKIGGRHLALLPVEGRYQERIFEHYGYEERDSTLHAGVL